MSIWQLSNVSPKQALIQKHLIFQSGAIKVLQPLFSKFNIDFFLRRFNSRKYLSTHVQALNACVLRQLPRVEKIISLHERLFSSNMFFGNYRKKQICTMHFLSKSWRVIHGF
jgi:hypothetical protein